MAKASDNEFPSLLVKEGSAPSSPAAGDQRVYIDSADHQLKRKNSSGTVTVVEGGLADQGIITYLDGTVAAAPGTPAAGKLRIYAKTGKVLAVKDDAGAETVLGAAGASSVTGVIGCRTSGSQAISVNPTAIQFTGTDIYDPDGWHDPSTNNGTRFVCPTGKGGGLFVVVAQLEYDIGAGGVGWRLALRLNGAGSSPFDAISQYVSDYVANRAFILQMADGDYVELLLMDKTTGSVVLSDSPCRLSIKG